MTNRLLANRVDPLVGQQGGGLRAGQPSCFPRRSALARRQTVFLSLIEQDNGGLHAGGLSQFTLF